jgi:hypothetical protein
VVIGVAFLSGAASIRGEDLSTTILDDPCERLLLCTPQGPIVVQLSLTVEGRPYRYATEKIVDEQFKLIAAQSHTWEGAFENGQFLAGRLLGIRTPNARAHFIARHDLHSDGIITRREVRSVLLADTQGDTARLFMHGLFPGSGADEQILAVIDVNGDWRLSADELRQAPSRLARADFSGDGAITDDEVGRADPQRKSPVDVHAVMLERLGSSGAAAQVLRAHYAGPQGAVIRTMFHLAPEIFDRLDADKDGVLQDAEMERIVGLPAHITVDVDYADRSAPLPQRLELRGTSSELRADEPTSIRSGMGLRWSKDASELSVSGISILTRQPSERAVDTMYRFDSNKNGYIEPEEGAVGGQFATWDLNGDGKVFYDELKDAFVQAAAIANCWIEIDVLRRAPRLWQKLDADSDNILGERELRKLPELLASFDADGDGVVAYSEMPFRMDVQIRRGARPVLRTASTGRQRMPPQTHGPKWFERMDRNGDRDISQREFLGTPEQFERLDMNGDGLIDISEAAAIAP